jgi:dTDP-4-dehydrorhamnose reductase
VLSNKGKEVRGFSNAIYSGFTTIELTKVIEKTLVSDRNLTGLFNVSSDPISKLEIINKLNSLLNLQMTVVPDDSMKIDRSLNSERFKLETGITIQNWDQMLAAFCEDQKTYV